MGKRTLVIVMLLIVLAAAVLAVYVASTMPKAESCEVILSEGGKDTKVDLNSLKLVDVKGTITRANGKTKEIDSKGLELRNLLAGKSYTDVTVSSSDNYSAELSAEEIAKEGDVFIYLADEKTPCLVVLSVSNAKRDVKNVLVIKLGQ